MLENLLAKFNGFGLKISGSAPVLICSQPIHWSPEVFATKSSSAGSIEHTHLCVLHSLKKIVFVSIMSY